MITLNNYKESTKHIAWGTMPKEYQEGNDFTLEVLGNVAFQNDKEIRDVAEQYVQKLNGYDKFDDNKPVPQKAAEKKAAKKLTDLAAMAKKAAAEGKQAPNYNLCEIEVPGTNIFCQDNKGIKRAKMPQLKGMPSPGTQAAKDSKGGGEVDGEAAFKKYLKDLGKTLKNETVLAEELKSTQNELVGVKVAGMTEALKKDPLNPGITAPIFISQDNYVLDGHHRWAAHVGLNLGNDKDVTMKVVRVNMPIKDLVKAANKFADDYGIKQKAATTTKHKVSGSMDAYLKKRFARYSDQQLVDLTNRLGAADKNDDDQIAELVRRAKEGRFKLVPEYDSYRIEPISKPVTKAATKRKSGQVNASKRKPKQRSASIPHKIKLQDFQNEVFIGLHDWIGKKNGGQSIQKSVAKYNATTDPQNKTLVKQTIEDESADRHKLEVYQALAAGLKVPDDVVKQYPKYENLHKAATKRKTKQKSATKRKKQDPLKALPAEAAKMTYAQVISTAQQIQAMRGRGKKVDERNDHSKRLTPTVENLHRWAKNPGRFDLIGIDTFKKDDPTADLKIRKEVFWARLGFKMK